MSDASEGALVVLRCGNCGDTFTVHEGAEAACPSCGGTDLHPAHEPLL